MRRDGSVVPACLGEGKTPMDLCYAIEVSSRMNSLLRFVDAQYNDLSESSRGVGMEMPTERFGQRRAGAHRPGYSVTAVAPDMRAWPPAIPQAPT